LAERYGWADGLAEYYANRHRSAFVFNYLMGSVAVLFGFLAFARKPTWVWATVELLILMCIIVIYRLARTRRWHERWLDYRLLAEHFRQMLILLALGPSSLFAVHATIFAAGDDPRNSWMNWHFRAYLRQAGLLNVRITSGYLRNVASFLKQHSVARQIEYHERNSQRHRKMSIRSYGASLLLFGLTLIACLWHLLDGESSSWLFGLIATFFPAVAAALAGIQHQGEFERIERRSEGMRQQLQQIAQQLDDLLESTKQITLVVVSHIARMAAQLMIDELLDWRVVFQVKSGPELG
jgi:hypothetical protein